MNETFHLSLSNGSSYPYQVRSSKRAKYIQIKLSQQGELSVIIPQLTRINLAHEFIHTKLSWIEKNLVKVKPVREKLPAVLELLLLNESWTIHYSAIGATSDSLPCIYEKPDFIIVIQGYSHEINDQQIVAKLLNNWCKKKAKLIFHSMLEEIAELHGFHFNRLSIRAQKTRWGSCSHQKNINLNCKLLFMPFEVVRYVMIHELCHTIEMNHSNRFWNLVQECDPNFKTHKKTLKTISKNIVI